MISGERKMEADDLIGRLGFKSDSVFLDGNMIFTVPFTNPAEFSINVLGLEYLPDTLVENKYRLFVGSGGCCYGPVSILEAKAGKTPHFEMRTLRIPDLNANDIIPARVNPEISDFPNREAFLVTGDGCAGGGVRLISTYYPRSREMVSTPEKTTEIVSTPDYRKCLGENVAVPRLRIDYQKGSISLDFMAVGFPRYPDSFNKGWRALPSIMTTKELQGRYVSQVVCASMDLTSALRDRDIDMEDTLTANRRYRRILH